jgi:threonine dehydrogenase-like Zn-dependent dehydrogenase
LCLVAALTALNCQAEIIVLARYGFQADAARKLGATHVVQGSNYYEHIVEITGAQLKKPLMGKPMVIGGVDCVFECVGSKSSLDDAIRFASNGGKVVFVGEPGVVKNLDWTPIFTQDLEVKPAYLYNHVEKYQDQQWKTFDLAIHLMETGQTDLSMLVTHKYRLEDFKQAFSILGNKKREGAIKVAFDFLE